MSKLEQFRAKVRANLRTAIPEGFWENIHRQYEELKSAKSADDVINILGGTNSELGPSSDAFFEGSGGDEQVYYALREAGWKINWAEADYYFAATAPDGSGITYVEGDIYRGIQAHGSLKQADNRDDLIAGADAAYDNPDSEQGQAWFDSQSEDDLIYLWNINPYGMYHSWDDEVYEALASKGFWDDEEEAVRRVKEAPSWGKTAASLDKGPSRKTAGHWDEDIAAFGGEEAADAFFDSLSTPEIRERQDLARQQIQLAYQQGNDRALENLQKMDDALFRAMMRRTRISSKTAATLDKGARTFVLEQLVAQIGNMNIGAVSGGRVEVHGNGIRLPVRYGYAVEVFLEDDDTYTVQTTFTRSGVTKLVNSSEGIYAEQVGEAVYQASLFRDKPWEKGGARTAASWAVPPDNSEIIGRGLVGFPDSEIIAIGPRTYPDEGGWGGMNAWQSGGITADVTVRLEDGREVVIPAKRLDNMNTFERKAASRKEGLSGLWRWEQSEDLFPANAAPSLDDWVVYDSKGQEAAYVTELANGSWEWGVFGPASPSSGIKRLVESGVAPTLEEGKKAAEFAGIPFPGQESLPFAARKTAGFNPTHTVVRNGESFPAEALATSSEFYFNNAANPLITLMDESGLLFYSNSPGVESVTPLGPLSVVDNRVVVSKRTAAPIGDWKLDEHVQVIDATPRSKVDEIWEKMNESEKFGVPMGLFPAWVGELTHEEVVELMGKTGSKKTAARPLYEIAMDIRREWGSNVNYAAAPYLDAMSSLDSINDMYGADSAKSIVAYFLSNASSFRGGRAKELKDELRAIQKGGSKTAAEEWTPETAWALIGNDSTENIKKMIRALKMFRMMNTPEEERRLSAAEWIVKNKVSNPRYSSKTAAFIGDDVVEQLRSQIAPLDTPERRQRYLSGDYVNSDRTKDLDRRYRWDLLWESGSGPTIYDLDANDEHIDTALRKVVPKLGKKTGYLSALQRGVRRVLALDPQSGYGDSSLPTVEEKTPDDEEMWPWEISDEERAADDAEYLRATDEMRKTMSRVAVADWEERSQAYRDGYKEGVSDASGQGFYRLSNDPRSSESDYAEGYGDGWQAWKGLEPHQSSRITNVWANNGLDPFQALEDTNTDETMWPVELPEGDDEDPASGEDAADVADVPTPGQSEDDYPQPKTGYHYDEFYIGDQVGLPDEGEGVDVGSVESWDGGWFVRINDTGELTGPWSDDELHRVGSRKTALTLDPDKEPDDQTPAFGWELPEDPGADPDLGQGAADVADVPTPGDALEGSYPQPSINTELDDALEVEGEEEVEDKESKTSAYARVAWTADQSDVSYMADKLMALTDQAMGPAYSGFRGSEEEKEAQMQEIESKLVELIKPLIGDITDEDQAILEDYNFHITNRAIDRAKGRKKFSRKTAGTLEDMIGQWEDLTDRWEGETEDSARQALQQRADDLQGQIENTPGGYEAFWGVSRSEGAKTAYDITVDIGDVIRNENGEWVVTNKSDDGHWVQVVNDYGIGVDVSMGSIQYDYEVVKQGHKTAEWAIVIDPDTGEIASTPGGFASQEEAEEYLEMFDFGDAAYVDTLEEAEYLNQNRNQVALDLYGSHHQAQPESWSEIQYQEEYGVLPDQGISPSELEDDDFEDDYFGEDNEEGYEGPGGGGRAWPQGVDLIESNLHRVGEWYDELGDGEDDSDDKKDEEESDDDSGDAPVEEDESAPEGEKEESESEEDEDDSEDEGEAESDDEDKSEPEDDEEKKEAFRRTVQANLRGMR